MGLGESRLSIHLSIEGDVKDFKTIRMRVEEHLESDVASGVVPVPRGFVSSQSSPLKTHTASCEVSQISYPYLADHGFQDMVVLPGSFYLRLALSIHSEWSHTTADSIRRIDFRNAIILSGQKISLFVKVQWLDDQTVQYSFLESDRSDRPCVVLEIECSHNPGRSGTKIFSAEKFRSKGELITDFYGRLKENGNQYGPSFQSLRQVWRSGNEVLARLRVQRDNTNAGRDYLDPIFVDGAVQALSALSLERGQTFILQGIEEIILPQNNFPDEAWVHACLRPKAGPDVQEQIGDIEVFDDLGTCHLKLRGVRFAYLNRINSEKKVEAPRTKIVVAANYTAEPIEDSLKFWEQYLDLPAEVRIAPYNQIFQELLNPDSQTRRNKDGVNVLLLNLDDWKVTILRVTVKWTREKAAVCFANLERHTLPGGIEIAHLNRHETEYVYQEIFVDQCYLRHGIHLPDNAVVVDIGATSAFSRFLSAYVPKLRFTPTSQAPSHSRR